MLTQIKFSIIITNYNYDRYLAVCIDSALNQKYRAHEVIIVDDGSTDLSHHILAEYADRCQIFYQQQGGQAAAMKAGYGLCVGDYVLFLDADDLLKEDALLDVCQLLQCGPVSKVHFALDVVDAEGLVFSRFPRSDQPLSSGELSRELLNRGTYTYPPCSGNVFSRVVLESIIPQMDPHKYRICADLFLLIKCTRFGPIAAIEKSLGAYRVHGENAYGVTRILELDRVRLQRRLSALQNKCELLAEECYISDVEISAAMKTRWVGLFGYKDLILGRRFYPEIVPANTPGFSALIAIFLGLLFHSTKATAIDKIKGVCFAVLSLAPKCLIRSCASWLDVRAS